MYDVPTCSRPSSSRSPLQPLCSWDQLKSQAATKACQTQTIQGLIACYDCEGKRHLRFLTAIPALKGKAKVQLWLSSVALDQSKGPDPTAARYLTAFDQLSLAPSDSFQTVLTNVHAICTIQTFSGIDARRYFPAERVPVPSGWRPATPTAVVHPNQESSEERHSLLIEEAPRRRTSVCRLM